MSNPNKGKWKEKLAQFFAGRYGSDQLGRLLSWVALGMLVLSLCLTKVAGGIPASILWYVAVAVFIWSIFRMYSKNIYKRQGENNKYLAIKRKIAGWFSGIRRQVKDQKEFKYFKCPQCKCILRVPRHKGKLNITCKKCGCKFAGRT